MVSVSDRARQAVMVKGKRILLVVGGTWHKFDEFAAEMRELFSAHGSHVETTRDLQSLGRLGTGEYDLVMMYTCLSRTLENGEPAKVLMTDELAEPLREWVAGGGSLLMMHSACVACQTSEVLRRLAGGMFLRHPPAMEFVVYPVFNEHPVIAGIPAFSVFDEFYIELAEGDAQVLMVAMYEERAYPMVWTRTEGRGRVAHIAMGHDERVWRLGAYRQLVAQAATWVVAS